MYLIQRPRQLRVAIARRCSGRAIGVWALALGLAFAGQSQAVAQPGDATTPGFRTAIARACPRCGRFHGDRTHCGANDRPTPTNVPRWCPPGEEVWEDAPLPGSAIPEELPPGTPGAADQQPGLEGTDRARAEVDRALEQANAATPDTSAQASNLGAAGSPQSNSPAMIGDFFGGGGTGRILVRGPTTIGPGTPFNIPLFNSDSGAPESVLLQLPPGFPSASLPVSFTSTNTPPFFPSNTFDSAAVSSVDNSAFLQAQSDGTVATFALPLVENSAFSQDAVVYFTALYPAGSVLPTGEIATGGGTAAYLSGTADFDAASSPATSQTTPRAMSGSDFYYLNWLYQYTPNALITPTIFLDVPNPSNSGGVVVGRMKIAENTSPIPRDRVFLNYSGFFNTPLAPGGVDVHRFVPGFEKTIFNGLASWEMRFPFASTIDTNFVAGGINSDGYVKYGNMSATYKMLLSASDTFLVSGGVQVALPTGSDINVSTPNGAKVARVGNSSVHVMPFFGALYTPNQRFFTQAFLQVDVDANGNPVQVDPTFSGGELVGVGRLNGPTFLYADLGAGYWMYRSESCRSRILGFAPTLELHYNRSLQAADLIVNRNIVIGDFFSNFELLNMTIGCYTQFSPVSILTLGYNTPLGGGQDKQFAGELRVAFNRRF